MGMGHRSADAKKPPAFAGGFFRENSGGDLLSQGVSPQVPSALAGLTSVFGMGTGVTLPLWPPETLRSGEAAAADRRGRPSRSLTEGLVDNRQSLEPSIASTSSKPSAD